MANEKRLDLIDRKELGIGYCNPLVFDKTEYAHGWNCAIEILMKAPTVEAVEVVHGKWIGLEYDGYADGFPVYDLWECSSCRDEFCGEDVPDMYNYCPNCGAKMDGVLE